MNQSNKLSTKKLTLIGMLGAISAVLMILEFPLPIVPGFIKMDFSELPIILGGYLMGPVAGSFIVILKILIKFLFKGTSTAGVGEISNMLYAFCYMLPSVLIYRKFLHSKSGAAISMAIGTVVTSIVSIFANFYFTFPAYAKLFGMSIDAIVGAGAAINSNIHDLFTMMIFCMLPFNLLKYGLVSLVTFLVYKRLHRLLSTIVD
ncbi:Substrate-specific component RibU of riboflavin ECF transporter [Lachnospiraceae bacterium TWA4]|nr:Substrate-specific component RibU of riboflavin ECF transporter [Lachnospiraceae bacterium TWA4]